MALGTQWRWAGPMRALMLGRRLAVCSAGLAARHGSGHALPSNVREMDEMVSAFRQGFPEVFRTRSGALRILDLACILQDDRDLCGDLLARVTPRRDGVPVSPPAAAGRLN